MMDTMTHSAQFCNKHNNDEHDDDIKVDLFIVHLSVCIASVFRF